MQRAREMRRWCVQPGNASRKGSFSFRDSVAVLACRRRCKRQQNVVFCYPEANGQNAARPEHTRHERGNVRRGITRTACPHGSLLSFVALILCDPARRAPGEGLIGIAGGHFAGLMPIWRQKQCDTHLTHRSQVVSPPPCAPILRGAPWGCWRDVCAGKPQGGTSPVFCTIVRSARAVSDAFWQERAAHVWSAGDAPIPGLWRIGANDERKKANGPV